MNGIHRIALLEENVYILYLVKSRKGYIPRPLGRSMLFPGTPDDSVMAAIVMHKAVDEYNKEREKKAFGISALE